MKCSILHETPGRMRVHLALRRMSLREADLLEYDLKGVAGVVSVKVFDRTQDAVITYTCPRMDIVRALASFSFTSEQALSRLPEHTSRALNREYEDKLVFTVCRRAFSRLFLPIPVRTAIALFRSVKYIRAGLNALLHGKLSVAVLDATAVTVSMVRGDFDTASSVMFMLRLGEILEEWTHKKSVADLAGAMALNVDQVWVKAGQTEVLVPVSSVKEGDLVVVRTGNLIALDGKVVEGEAMVNQSSMTGESMPVVKHEGSFVYAGTVCEEGECVFRVEKTMGGGRYDRIVKMIEQSEKLKSTAEDKAARLADRLVPYTLGGTVLTYLLTRDGAYLAADAQRQPRARRADGRFLVRAQACHADCGFVRHARGKRVPHLRQGRQIPRGSCKCKHRRLRQDRHAHLRHAESRRHHHLCRLQRRRHAASCRVPGRALPALDGKRRGRGGKGARIEPRGIPLAGAVYRRARHLQHGRGQKGHHRQLALRLRG